MMTYCSKYMLVRAYRPSDMAHACLLSCTALMHEASQADKQALDCQQAAHEMLCAPRLEADHWAAGQMASWTQVSRR